MRMGLSQDLVGDWEISNTHGRWKSLFFTHNPQPTTYSSRQDTPYHQLYAVLVKVCILLFPPARLGAIPTTQELAL